MKVGKKQNPESIEVGWQIGERSIDAGQPNIERIGDSAGVQTQQSEQNTEDPHKHVEGVPLASCPNMTGRMLFATGFHGQTPMAPIDVSRRRHGISAGQHGSGGPSEHRVGNGIRGVP